MIVLGWVRLRISKRYLFLVLGISRWGLAKRDGGAPAKVPGGYHDGGAASGGGKGDGASLPRRATHFVVAFSESPIMPCGVE